MEGIWEETKKIWRIGFPSMLFRVTSFGVMVVTQSFIGHINEIDLAAFALVQTISVRFSNAILLGMSSATETLCGQAFGAKQYHMMGIYLQRSWIVNLLTATTLLPFLICATPIYKLLGQDHQISAVAGTISLWFIPITYSFTFAQTIQMYLQAQQKNMVVGWLSATAFVVHVCLSWLFVYELGWGLHGAMCAMIISLWGMVSCEFVYIFCGFCPNTWKGFSTAAFTDLWPIVKLSVSSGLMICFQVWYTSILVLISGYTKDAATAISAFSICLNISQWELMICLGFLGATCVRVSNELGRGNAKAVIFSIKVALGTSFAIGVIFWLLFMVFGSDIPKLFTSDEEVAKAASNIFVLLAFTVLLSSIQPVLSGAAVGSGSQTKVAIVNLCSYYLVGIPLGVLLAYVAHLGVKGIWIGMLCGMATQASVLLYITWKTDWNDQVTMASERLNRYFLLPAEESDQNPNQV